MLIDLLVTRDVRYESNSDIVKGFTLACTD